MPELATTLPARRPDLLLRPLGDRGRYVVKDPRTGAYFTFGEQEYFLLCQLDGERGDEEICRAFQERFGEPLSEEDLDGFLELARSKGFLLPDGAAAPTRPEAAPPAPGSPAGPADAPPTGEAASPRSRQSILFWRVSLFDPDRLFNRLAPCLWFLWTRAFLVVSAAGIVLGAALVWANRHELVSTFARAWRWETFFLAWLTLILATTLHEFAHGLTCKHHGGEVHEVGFLLMFFIPCLFCNVSDAWLFKEKSKRLWVTLAGAYCDLCMWALAVCAWRLTFPDSLPNYLAWVVLSVVGARVFFNFNPLLKLDGYYLLSDVLEVPNLRQRSWGYVTGHLRWLLWGAPRPSRQARGGLLFAYGVASWLFSVFFLTLMLWGFYRLLGEWLGPTGMILVGLMGVPLLLGMFQGLGGREVRTMILKRPMRTVMWLLALGGLTSALVFIQVEERAGGPFQLRPVARAEVRAPVAGFLRAVHVSEGDRVSPGAPVACLEVPDLESRLEQKRAEVRESRARLRLLEVGPRPEEIREKRLHVARAKAWRELAEQDLRQARKAFEEDLKQLEEKIGQHGVELEHAQQTQKLVRDLLVRQAAGDAEYQEAMKQLKVAKAQQEQARAAKGAREALGTRQAEAELARRENELADARSALTLLEAGTRPEEIDAEQARLARLQEEARYLEGLQGKLRICSPGPGVVTTPRLKEKVGQYLREGDLICLVEEPDAVEAEVTLDEEEVARVRPDQAVTLKARALPLETFQARVSRLAPVAVRDEAQTSIPAAARAELPGTVTIYCRLEDTGTSLRPGMSGHARIASGPCSLGEFLLGRGFRFFRTEFWW